MARLSVFRLIYDNVQLLRGIPVAVKHPVWSHHSLMWSLLPVAATIVLSSTAGAAEYRGGRLGEYREEGDKFGGRTYYIQKNTEGAKPQYLYFDYNCWRVSGTLGNGNDYIKNCQNTTLPPIGYEGWEYVANVTQTTPSPWSSPPSPPAGWSAWQGAAKCRGSRDPAWATTGRDTSLCWILYDVHSQVSISKEIKK